MAFKNKNENEKYETSSSFEQMNLNEDLLRGIYAYGWEKPSYIQQKGISPVIQGEDCIIQAQSGTGKTGTFSIACLQKVDYDIKSCQCIILNPTREIADQTCRVITNLSLYMKDMKIISVIGGRRVQTDDVSNAYIIVATPGRVYDMIDRRMESRKIKKKNDE